MTLAVSLAVSLVVSEVSKRFGGVAALARVSFTVDRGAIVGLIGPNGAGKSTLFNCVSGLYHPDAGTIRFGAHDLVGRSSASIAALGVARTFQNVRLFGELRVIENLLVAGQARGLDDRALDREARALLERFDLAGDAERKPGELAYGQKRKLEIARALMTAPKLLLLDEPAAGFHGLEADALGRMLRALRDELALTIVLVEHNMGLVMKTCDAVHVLDHGESIAHGTPDQVKRDPRVVAAYLGEDGAS